MSGNIILIGFMGSGKTSVGRSLSDVLGVKVLDTDELISEQEQMPVREIFSRKGEDYFRKAETETIRKLQNREEQFVLSVGGGLPLRAENRPLLRRIGTVVYLKTGIQTLAGRLSGDHTRPLLDGEGPLEDRISEILRQREPLYEEAADRIVITDGKTVRQVAAEICNMGTVLM